jgi:hypothetical protein
LSIPDLCLGLLQLDLTQFPDRAEAQVISRLGEIKNLICPGSAIAARHQDGCTRCLRKPGRADVPYDAVSQIANMSVTLNIYAQAITQTKRDAEPSCELAARQKRRKTKHLAPCVSFW